MNQETCLVFLTCEKNISQLVKFLSTQRDCQAVIISKTSSLQANLAKHGLTSHLLSDIITSDELIQFEDNVLHWIKKWANQPILGDQSIKELLLVDQVSLWWFFEAHPFYYKYFHEKLIALQVISRLLNEYQPSQLIIHTEDNELFQVATIIGKSQNIPVKFLVEPSKEKRFLIDIARKYPNIPLYLKNQIQKVWLKVHSSGTAEKSKQEDPTILLLTPEREWRPIIDPNTGETRNGVILVDEVLRYLQENNFRTLNVVITTWATSSRIELLKEMQSTYPGVSIRIPEQFITRDLHKTVSKHIQQLRNVWRNLKDTPSFIASFDYEDINFYDLMTEAFEDLFRRVLPDAVRTLVIAEQIIIQEKPALCLLPCEYCSTLSYAMIVMAKKHGLPTIAIQHGIITSRSIEYVTSKMDVEQTATSKLQVIPSKFCVFGPFTKEILIKDCNYPENGIQVTGSPYYDTLSSMKIKHTREQTLQELGLPLDRFIITYTSQAFPSVSLRKEVMETILSAIDKLPDCHLVVKPHPADDLKMLRAWIDQHSTDNVTLLSHNVHLSQILRATDAMITVSSTTLFEALILDIPLVMYTPPSVAQMMPFTAQEVVMPAKTPEDIIHAIRAIKESTHSGPMNKQRQDFRYNQIYLSDGKASQRIKELILHYTKHSTLNGKN